MAPNAILLVDDETAILSALEREIGEWARDRNLEIVKTSSALGGLDFLVSEAGRTAIVVSDLRMPGMLGSDFLMKIHESYPGIVTLILSGYSDVSEIIKGVNAGIFAYISKPWDTRFLLAELEKAYQFRRLRKENDEYRKLLVEELKWAGDFQRSLLKPSPGIEEQYAIQITYTAMDGLYVSGDYYDVIPIDNERCIVLLGDVSGHGLRAALITSMLKAIIGPEYMAVHAGTDFSPAHFLSWLNGRLIGEFEKTPGTMLTFMASYVDKGKRLVRWANAGHPHPYVVIEGVASVLEDTGPGLGVFREATYIEREDFISAGGFFWIFSDGLVEVSEPEDGDPRDVDLKPIIEWATAFPDRNGKTVEKVLEANHVRKFRDDVVVASILFEARR